MEINISNINDLVSAVSLPDWEQHYTRDQIRGAVSAERTRLYEEHDAEEIEALRERVAAKLEDISSSASIAMKTFEGITDDAAREFFATNTESAKAVQQYAEGAFNASISKTEARLVLGAALAKTHDAQAFFALKLSLERALAWVNRPLREQVESEEHILGAVSGEYIRPDLNALISAAKNPNASPTPAQELEYYAFLESQVES